MKTLLFMLVLFQAALPSPPPKITTQALPGLPPFECDGCCDAPGHCCDATHCW